MLLYLMRQFAFFITLAFAGIQLSAQTPEYEWRNLQIGGGGYVTGIVIHPSDKNVMYIRTDVGGAYRWDEKTSQWKQMLNWVGPENANLIGVDGIALDPGKPDRVYLALGRRIDDEGGIFRSDDRGETWTKLFDMSFEGNGREARWIGECIAVDPVNSRVIYVGTRKNGLWHSSDDGKTWTKVQRVPDGFTGNNPTGVRSIAFDPAEKINGRSSTIYAGVPRSGIYVSNDGGATFNQMNGSPENPARMQLADRELFVTHSKGVAFFSAGKWDDISPVPDKNYVGISVDVTNSKRIIAAQQYKKFNNPIYRSENKGQTWEQINTKEFPANLHSTIPWWPKTWFSSSTAGMALEPNGSGGLYYTDWFGVWHTPNVWAKSTDWYPIEKGHEETVVLTLISPPSGALVYSGVADVFGFRHDKLDAYPEKRLYPIQECFSIAVCETKPSSIAVLGAKSWGGDQSVLVTSPDFGETWTERALPNGEILGRIAISSLNPDHLVYVSGSGKVYYSHTNGKSWAASQNAPEDVINWKDIWNRDKILASDGIDGSFYILKNHILYASTDGVSWVAKNKIPVPDSSDRVKSIVPVPGRSGEIWICLDKNGLWKSTDAGTTYSRVTEFDTAKLICWGAPAPGSADPTAWCYGIIKGKWGIYRSTDKGRNWVRINDDKHQFPGGVAVIDGDKNTFGRIYIGSSGCGIYYGEPVKK